MLPTDHTIVALTDVTRHAGVEHGRPGADTVRAAGWDHACRAFVDGPQSSTVHLQPSPLGRLLGRREALLLRGAASACWAARLHAGRRRLPLVRAGVGVIAAARAGVPAGAAAAQ